MSAEPDGDGDERDPRDAGDGDDGAGDGPAKLQQLAADPDFRNLLAKIDHDRNVDFSEYKEASLVRRVTRRMRQVRVDSFDAYASYLDRHPGEYVALINTILINVTRFFRDPDAWAVLRENVIPRLVQEAEETRSLRVWSAGCSTGEEPFSLAILIAEALGRRAREFDVKIYATDIDDGALAAARAAVFRLEQLGEMPPALLGRYFAVEKPQLYRLQRDVRKWCIFGQHNLTQDPPLAHMDLIACRNVLIYFDGELQDRIIPRLHYALRERGVLFLGRAESLLSRSRRFTTVDAKWRVFERVTTAVNPRMLGPLLPAAAAASAPAPPAPPPPPPADGLTHMHRGLVEALQTAIMAIDTADVVVLWNPAAEALYDLPADGAVGHKFRDLHVSYRVEGLRARIEEVKTKRVAARMDGVRLTGRAGERVHADIAIAPLLDERSRLVGVLVAATDVTETARLRDEMARLGDEYATANEELQSMNEELETANEELQSTNEELETTNEELQSTNEELETTNEELQSTNAELGTLNAEIEKRTAGLNRANDFQQTVLGSIEEGFLVTDAKGVVVTWNRALARMWGASAEDAVGREFQAVAIDEGSRVVREAVARVLQTRRRETLPAVPYTIPGGEERRAVVHISPLVDAAGNATGVVAVAIAEEPAKR